MGLLHISLEKFYLKIGNISYYYRDRGKFNFKISGYKTIHKGIIISRPRQKFFK